MPADGGQNHRMRIQHTYVGMYTHLQWTIHMYANGQGPTCSKVRRLERAIVEEVLSQMEHDAPIPVRSSPSYPIHEEWNKWPQLFKKE